MSTEVNDGQCDSCQALVFSQNNLFFGGADPSSMGIIRGRTDETEEGNHMESQRLPGDRTYGKVVIVAHRSEMGTGIRTALPMVVADELDADWRLVTVKQAMGNAKYGSQDTDGSRSIRDFYEIMRQAGATARLMLERAAAAKWGVAPEECETRKHKVVHIPSGRNSGYGELIKFAAKQPVPKAEELRFKSRKAIVT